MTAESFTNVETEAVDVRPIGEKMKIRLAYIYIGKTLKVGQENLTVIIVRMSTDNCSLA